MAAVAKLSNEDFALFQKYKNKAVIWEHPCVQKSNWGRITGIENGFLLVEDTVATEGIRESWITYVYK